MEEYIRKIFITQNGSVMVQFFRYAIVGGAAAFVDISVFTVVASSMGINHIIANTISFTFGLMVNYFMSRNWVFNQQSYDLRRDFFLFAVIGILGLLLSNLILYLLLDRRLLYNVLNLMSINNDPIIKLLAKLMTVFVVLFWNFIARKKIVFN